MIREFIRRSLIVGVIRKTKLFGRTTSSYDKDKSKIALVSFKLSLTQVFFIIVIAKSKYK
jgi:hypothetical protein